MSDVISAVLGEKQRVLMEALADFNKNVIAAKALDPEGKYATLYLSTDGSTGRLRAPRERSIVSKRVAVSQKDILNWLLEIEGGEEEVLLDYEDSNGNVTKDRMIRVTRVENQRNMGLSRYRPTMVVAWDIEKQAVRNFVLSRIQRVESVL